VTLIPGRNLSREKRWVFRLSNRRESVLKGEGGMEGTFFSGTMVQKASPGHVEELEVRLKSDIQQ
jgi:hypothetical protein